MSLPIALSKKHVGVAVAAVVLVASLFVPGTEDLPQEGVHMLGVFLMAAVLWITEALPVGVTGLLALTLAVMLGVAPVGEAFSGFATPTMFYLMGAFSMAAVLERTSYGMRLVVFLLKRMKGDSGLVVLSFMIAAALLSSITSDTTVVLMFVGFAKVVCDALGCKPKESNFARCLYIGLLYAAIVGGFATLSGGPNNMTVLQISGASVSYLEWMAVGIPVSIVMVPVCWFFVTRAFPPEHFPRTQLDGIIEQTESAGAPTRHERKALAFVILLPVLWIAGTWIPALNVTVVAVLGLAIAFLPGVNLLTWKQYQDAVPWVVLVMVGCIFSMSSLMANILPESSGSSVRSWRQPGCSPCRFPSRCSCTSCSRMRCSPSARSTGCGSRCSFPYWAPSARSWACRPPLPRSPSCSASVAISFCPSTP